MTRTCADVDFDIKLAEFKINGYTVFDDMIPGQKIDRLRDTSAWITGAMLPLDGGNLSENAGGSHPGMPNAPAEQIGL